MENDEKNIKDSKEDNIKESLEEKNIEKKRVSKKTNKMDNNEAKKTYLCLGSEETLLELDLVKARSKGEEIKYLSIVITRKNKVEEKQEEQYNLTLDENGFNEVKNFFTQLDWNY